MRADREGKRYALRTLARNRWLSAERGVLTLGLANTKPNQGPWEEWYIAPSEGCAKLPDVDINTTVEVRPSPGQPLFGIADLHGHMFTNEGFGGIAFYGEPAHQNGLARSLYWCNLAHGEGGVLDPIGSFLDGTVGHLVGGSPEFNGWPRWNSSNHQQMYYRWLERAFRGGLRLQTLLAVNNEVLCDAYRKIGRTRYSCDDMPSVDRQLEGARQLEAFIDREHGGPGRGWFRIARSAREARDIIESGKMAVVLGIEVSALFGCKEGNDRCTEEHVRQQLDKYHALGVRHVFPVHVFDNAFGGAALYNPLFTVGNKVANGRYFGVEDCAELGYPGIEYNANLGISQALLSLLGTGGLPSYPPARGHCNEKTLTPLGAFLIRELMSRKMIIDVDHMGARTLDAVFTLVEAQDYPVVRGHTSFTEQGIGQARSETVPNSVERIRRLGGLVAPILHQGKASSRRPHGPVAHDCDESSKSWAQVYSYAVDRVQGAVPLGSDMNGWIHQPAPRFGGDACAKNQAQARLQGNRVTYPFNAHEVPGTFGRLRSADRVFDYNTDGFANIGLLPDFIQDLKNVGLSDEALKPLFSSAEAYVAMWEKIDSR